MPISGSARGTGGPAPSERGRRPRPWCCGQPTRAQRHAALHWRPWWAVPRGGVWEGSGRRAEGRRAGGGLWLCVLHGLEAGSTWACVCAGAGVQAQSQSACVCLRAPKFSCVGRQSRCPPLVPRGCQGPSMLAFASHRPPALFPELHLDRRPTTDLLPCTPRPNTQTTSQA